MLIYLQLMWQVYDLAIFSVVAVQQSDFTCEPWPTLQHAVYCMVYTARLIKSGAVVECLECKFIAAAAHGRVQAILGGLARLCPQLCSCRCCAELYRTYAGDYRKLTPSGKNSC